MTLECNDEVEGGKVLKSDCEGSIPSFATLKLRAYKYVHKWYGKGLGKLHTFAESPCSLFKKGITVPATRLL